MTFSVEKQRAKDRAKSGGSSGVGFGVETSNSIDGILNNQFVKDFDKRVSARDAERQRTQQRRNRRRQLLAKRSARQQVKSKDFFAAGTDEFIGSGGGGINTPLVENVQSREFHPSSFELVSTDGFFKLAYQNTKKITMTDFSNSEVVFDYDDIDPTA